jgi:glutamate--cysteine ligase
MVPHLITALNGPINELEQRILDSMPAIERWFRLEWMEHTPPFYSSVDVRNAGFKLAPVDTNLFPGGWNNLTPAMLPLAVQAAMVAIEKICPEAKNLLLIPENHSNNLRNTFYLSSIAQLRRIFHMAGLNVRIGSIDPEIKQNTTVELPNGESIVLEPVIRGARRLGLKDFDPCTILLNNELTKGLPGILEELHEQFVLPPLHASGSIRRKSTHYKSYEDVCKRFGKLLGVDPWLINPMFNVCDGVDLAQSTGLDGLATHVDALLAKIKKKYKEYGINEKPFVVVKTNHSSLADKNTGHHAGSSTGVMMLRSSSELKDRKDLASFSGELVVQEGVLTKERMNDAVAEPVVYMMDRYVVGGFYRVHADRGMDENLCSPGSRYVPLAFAEGTELPTPGLKPGASAPNRFYMYGVIGRLAMVAASYELEATDPDAEVYE